MTQTKVEAPFVEGGGGTSFKNLLVNGDYQIWQRGTSAATVTDSSSAGTYLADRWQTWEDTGGTITQEQSALDNDDFETTGMRNALLVKCTGTDSSIGAAEFAFITQKIEAQNCQGLQYGTDNAKDVTLSFWVKSNLAATFTAVLRKPDSTYYYIPKEYTIASANTWQKVTLTYGPDDTNGSVIKASSGNIVNDNGEGIWVQFSLALGSNFHGTAGSWVSAVSGLGTSNQTNFMSSTSNNFYLTGVQLEAGNDASDFEHLPFDVQLQRCRRYLQRVEASGTNYGSFGVGANANTASSIGHHMLSPNMRSVPTLITTGTAANYSIFNGSTSLDACSQVPAINGGGGTNSQVRLEFITNSSTLTAGQATEMLSSDGVAAFLMFSAEL
jgi:hypothetical protein